MRIIILTGNQPNQAALCHKIIPHAKICAIVLSRNISRKKQSIKFKVKISANKMFGRLIGQPFVLAWKQLQEKYRKAYPYFPDVPLLHVDNINNEETLNVIEKFEPDLVVVSGTNLISEKLIQVASKRRGIINLHTGISPYIKGGPNCTNWCLATGNFHLIGNTIMWLDAGIDTGRIIVTEQTSLSGIESLPELHWKVMEHAHDLYVRAIKRIAAGENVKGIPQESIAKGRTFYTIDWNGKAIFKALLNFKYRYRAAFERKIGKTESLNLIKLDE